MKPNNLVVRATKLQNNGDIKSFIPQAVREKKKDDYSNNV
jgi:hypothetical protein